MTWRLLDLFCGVGGCAGGFLAAGFEVDGIDHVRQWEYPGRFELGDALTWPLDGYDVVHASPPCKSFTVANRVDRAMNARLFDQHADLLTPTLERLRAWGGVWIVENVPGAPMPSGSVTLCGSAFGLRVRRHRLFASSIALTAPPCRHDEQPHPVGVYGNGGPWKRRAAGGGGVKVAGPDAADALGITWSTDQRVLSQAIPPAYTEHLGRQLIAHLERVSA